MTLPAAIRPRPPIFRALGLNDPPPYVMVDAGRYERVDIFKHDSWAATARYHSAAGDIVCKFNRIQPATIVSTAWLGRRLADRERRALQLLADLTGIPNESGKVYVDGKLLPNAVAHEYIPGRPLKADERLSDDFFPTLLATLNEIHARDMAYVDLHKRENILVGDDGRPYLIDFQVCFANWEPRQKRDRVRSRILKSLQQLDRYHLAKHVRFRRPDQIDALGLRGDCERPGWLNWHRTLTIPLREARRRLLVALRIRDRSGKVETEACPEDGHRPEPAPLNRAA